MMTDSREKSRMVRVPNQLLESVELLKVLHREGHDSQIAEGINQMAYRIRAGGLNHSQQVQLDRIEGAIAHLTPQAATPTIAQKQVQPRAVTPQATAPVKSQWAIAVGDTVIHAFKGAGLVVKVEGGKAIVKIDGELHRCWMNTLTLGAG